MGTSTEDRDLVSYEGKEWFWGALQNKWLIHGFLLLTVAVVLMPNIWMFWTFQQYIVRGLTGGAVKE